MRSFLVLIFVVQAALICAAQFEDKIDYKAVKLRKVNAGQGAKEDQAAADSVADSVDNKARVESIWGVKLRHVDKSQAAAPAEQQSGPALQNVILSKPAERAQAATVPVVAEASQPVPVEVVKKAEPMAQDLELESETATAEAQPVMEASDAAGTDDDDEDVPIAKEEPAVVKAEEEEGESEQQHEPAEDVDSDDDDDDYWPLKAAMRRNNMN